jgi:wobble nucleotide-excising tRNase
VPALSPDQAFLAANLARKMLESFLTFKFPKARGDLNALFTRALRGCVLTNEETKEKIYRFINKYSHSAVVEINEDSFENMLGESYSVVGDIFVWMAEIDKDHYDEMEEVLRAGA